MYESDDLYELLGVSPTASPEVIAAAYKAMMKRYHPDAGGNTEQAQRINNAYDVLRDPLLRAEYDRTRRGNPRSREASAESHVICPRCRTKNNIKEADLERARCGRCGEPFVSKEGSAREPRGDEHPKPAPAPTSPGVFPSWLSRVALAAGGLGLALYVFSQSPGTPIVEAPQPAPTAETPVAAAPQPSPTPSPTESPVRSPDMEALRKDLRALGGKIADEDPDQKHWIDIYQRLSNENDSWGSFQLGLRYFYGQGVKQDVQRAIPLFEKAMKGRPKNDSGFNTGAYEAAHHLAVAYDSAEFVEKDVARAVDHFIAAATVDMPMSLNMMKEYAAEQSASAKAALGAIYLFGLKQQVDVIEAQKWLTPAAEQGHDIAQTLLAELLMGKQRGGNDLIQAHAWAKSAAEHGNKRAIWRTY